MNRALLLAASVTLAGCVLPADEPTGLELSWRLVEVNTVDGEDAQRLRTCSGGLADEVVFSITDLGDPERSDSFRYDCDFGYRTPAEFQTGSSDAFIELRPRTYSVEIDIVGVDGDGTEIVRRARDTEIDVLERSVTLQDFDFGLEPAELVLELRGLDACMELDLNLRYDDPEAALAEPPRDDDDEVLTPLTYREGLVADSGLSLGGGVRACDSLDASHRFTEVDPGNYVLDVAVDGAVCPVELQIALGGAEHVIDLANLPCDG